MCVEEEEKEEKKKKEGREVKGEKGRRKECRYDDFIEKRKRHPRG